MYNNLSLHWNTLFYYFKLSCIISLISPTDILWHLLDKFTSKTNCRNVPRESHHTVGVDLDIGKLLSFSHRPEHCAKSTSALTVSYHLSRPSLKQLIWTLHPAFLHPPATSTVSTVSHHMSLSWHTVSSPCSLALSDFTSHSLLPLHFSVHRAHCIQDFQPFWSRWSAFAFCFDYSFSLLLFIFFFVWFAAWESVSRATIERHTRGSTQVLLDHNCWSAVMN